MCPSKVLLHEPDILLLDEPTKGIDNDFKRVFAQILKTLTEQGVCVIMVSHDVGFCASYADRCGLFFDGGIVTMDAPQPFFAGKNFYTTAANRMARHLLPDAVTPEDVIRACGGELPKLDKPKPPEKIDISLPEEHRPKKIPLWRKIVTFFAGLASLALLIYTSAVLDLSRLYSEENFPGDRLWIYLLLFILLGLFAAGISRRAPIREQKLMQGKLSKRTKISLLFSFLAIPLTIAAGLMMTEEDATW